MKFVLWIAGSEVWIHKRQGAGALWRWSAQMPWCQHGDRFTASPYQGVIGLDPRQTWIRCHIYTQYTPSLGRSDPSVSAQFSAYQKHPVVRRTQAPSSSDQFLVEHHHHITHFGLEADLARWIHFSCCRLHWGWIHFTITNSQLFHNRESQDLFPVSRARKVLPKKVTFYCVANEL